jgi:hypothetical protein
MAAAHGDRGISRLSTGLEPQIRAWRIEAESSLRGAERRSNPGNEGRPTLPWIAMTATAPSKRAMLLEKTSAAAKPCSRGLYDRRSDVGLVIEPAAWMAGGVVHSGGRQFGDMPNGFGFGQVDGGDLVGGEEDAASVAAHGPYGGAFAPEASSGLIPRRSPWRPHAICFHAAKGLDVTFFRFRATDPPWKVRPRLLSSARPRRMERRRRRWSISRQARFKERSERASMRTCRLY